MSSGMLTTLGLYNYDTSIFEGFQVPAGMNKANAIKQILLGTQELEVLYPEPQTLKVAISMWSAHSPII